MATDVEVLHPYGGRNLCDEAYCPCEEVWFKQQVKPLREVFGDLIDALGDELKYEISHSSHVQEHMKRAIAVLGGPWRSYDDSWWLGGTAASERGES